MGGSAIVNQPVCSHDMRWYQDVFAPFSAGWMQCVFCGYKEAAVVCYPTSDFAPFATIQGSYITPSNAASFTGFAQTWQQDVWPRTDETR